MAREKSAARRMARRISVFMPPQWPVRLKELFWLTMTFVEIL